MMKKIISVFLSIILIISSLSFSLNAFALKTTDVAKTQIGTSDTYYEFDARTKTLTLSGNGAIPNMLNNDSSQPWTTWRSDGSIERVIVEEGITGIGNYVLYYVCAKEVQLPSTLKSIGNYALAYNTEIESYRIPFGVKSIGASAFENCISMKEVDIPDTVTIINKSAFKQCYKLESVLIPHSVTSIGNYAFHRCLELSSAKFESLSTLEKIGNYAFQNCPELTELTVPAYATVGKLFYGVNDSGTKYDNASMKLFSGSEAIVYAKTKSISYTLLDEIPLELGAVNNDEFFEETVSNAIDYSFTPKTSGVYNIYSTGEVDLSAVLSDEGGELLRSDDIAKDNLNFCLTYDMEAGRKYVVTVTSVKSVGEFSVIAYPEKIESFSVSGSLAFEAGDGRADGDKIIFEITDDMLSDFVLDIAFGGDFNDKIYYSPGYFNNRFISISDKQNEEPFTCGNNTENIAIGEAESGFNVYIEHTSAVDAAVEPTCTKTGLTEGSSCLLCKKVFVAQETVEMKPHTYEATVTDPTCSKMGYTTHKCSACGYSYVDEYTQPTGEHTYVDEVVKEPTCIEKGVRKYTCSVCGEVIAEQTVVEALGHNYEKTVTEPTCTKQGYTTYTCTRCDDSYIADYTEATGHKETKIKGKAATFKAAGKTEGKKCSVCGKVLVAQKSIAKLGSPKLSKVTAGKKRFKATWKAVKNIDGYQIQYSTDKNFKKGVKTVKIKGYKSKSKTVKSLKAKKKYYVRIRGYKKINKTTKYSSWSKSKAVTTKK